MSHDAFHNKWSWMGTGQHATNLEERSVYVDVGQIPRTQRQLSLYWCFRFIRHHLQRIGAKSVVELGCGRGTIGLYCRDYLGLEVTLLDREDAAIEIAREAFEAHDLEASFLVGDALQTGLPEEAFDATLSIGLAEHLDDVVRFFAEQLRILRPGGLMISLNIPRKISVQHLNFLMRMVKKRLGLYDEPIYKDYYRNAYTAREYAAFAEDVGFDAAGITHVGPFPFYIPIRSRTDRAITTIRRAALRVRSLVMPYPYRTNPLRATGHFLVARKPI